AWLTMRPRSTQDDARSVQLYTPLIASAGSAIDFAEFSPRRGDSADALASRQRRRSAANCPSAEPRSPSATARSGDRPNSDTCRLHAHHTDDGVCETAQYKPVLPNSDVSSC